MTRQARTSKTNTNRTNYRYGIKQEDRVARSLRGGGAKVKQSPGSLGANDLTARFPTGRTWVVQVKASRSGAAASPSRNEIRRLNNVATRRGATPVVAKVESGKVTYTSARSGRKLSATSRRASK